jgi:hypothetical protein
VTNQGFIKIHRSIIDWEWYNDLPVFKLFTHLLLIANFEDKKWRGILVKRGELITSLENLANSTRLSIQQVRTSLNKLKLTGEIAVKSTNKFTLIHLVKYGIYQENTKEDNKQNGTENNKPSTNEQQTNNNQSTINQQQLKNVKN